MLGMLQDLIRHKGYVNASLLKAIFQQEQAAQDQELRDLLHHIILSNRFWLHLFLELPFDLEKESLAPQSLDAIASLYRDTHAQELDWISRIQERDLARTVATPFIPDRTFSVSQGVMQVCMHSHAHRAQCAAKLRALGGVPPFMDFILWLKDRPASDRMWNWRDTP